MASLNGVTTKKGNIGPNVIDKGDGISGIIIASQEKPAGIEYGDLLTMYNLVDVDSSGITAEFDSTNNVNVHRHLSEFYRMAGEGQKLYVMLIPASETIENTYSLHVSTMMINAGGEIRQIAFARNLDLAIDATPVYIDGIPKDVHDSIPLAQVFAKGSFDFHMPLHVLIECYDYKGPGSSAANLRDLAINATKVTLVNGQDWSYADTKSSWSQKYADVGTALGTLSACRINQNIGENESFNITDTNRGIWEIPGLSSHSKNLSVYHDLQTLEDKGYVFGSSYTGLNGVRWNNDHVCAEIIIDAEGNINEHTIAFGRTLDKAVRLLRTAYLTEIKKTYPVNTETGLLPTGVIKNFEGIGNTVFADMAISREISGGSVTVDPQSDLLVEKILKVSYRIVPYGTIGEISGTINLKNRL